MCKLLHCAPQLTLDLFDAPLYTESAATWEHVARDHPEFFRVQKEGTHRTSLIARHVTRKDPEGVRELPAGFIESLLSAAVEMHDRQVKRAERWVFLIPIWVAVIAGVFSLIGIGLKLWLGAE